MMTSVISHQCNHLVRHPDEQNWRFVSAGGFHTWYISAVDKVCSFAMHRKRRWSAPLLCVSGAPFVWHQCQKRPTICQKKPMKEAYAARYLAAFQHRQRLHAVVSANSASTGRSHSLEHTRCFTASLLLFSACCYVASYPPASACTQLAS